MKVRVYRYIIDGVNDATLPVLRKTVSVVPGMKVLGFDRQSSVLSVEAAADQEDSVKMACSVSGVRFRVRMA
jgi:hypothetical protein